MNIYIMYHPKFYTPFVKGIFEIAAPDLVVWIYPVDKKIRNEFPIRNMSLWPFLRSPEALLQERYFAFDYFLAPVLMSIELLRARNPDSEFLYIQHGLIEPILHVSRRSNYMKYINAIPIVTTFLSNRRLEMSLTQRVRYIRQAWKRNFDALRQRKIFSMAYFFIKNDFAWAKENLDVSQEYFLYQSDAGKKIVFDPDGARVYVSQPLVEDNILTQHQYRKLLAFVAKAERPDLVLLHPRDESTLVVLAELGEDIPSMLLGEQNQIPVCSLIGHFSTLLEEVPHVDRVIVDIHEQTSQYIERQAFEELPDLRDLLT